MQNQVKMLKSFYLKDNNHNNKENNDEFWAKPKPDKKRKLSVHKKIL